MRAENHTSPPYSMRMAVVSQTVLGRRRRPSSAALPAISCDCCHCGPGAFLRFYRVVWTIAPGIGSGRSAGV